MSLNNQNLSPQDIRRIVQAVESLFEEMNVIVGAANLHKHVHKTNAGAYVNLSIVLDKLNGVGDICRDENTLKCAIEAGSTKLVIHPTSSKVRLREPYAPIDKGDKSLRTVFITNLPPTITKDRQILEEFRQYYGSMVRVRILNIETNDNNQKRDFEIIHQLIRRYPTQPVGKIEFCRKMDAEYCANQTHRLGEAWSNAKFLLKSGEDKENAPPE